MREDELQAKFAGISVFEKDGYRAPHKPLLILLAIGRAIRNQPRLAYYSDLEEPLAGLLHDFGRPAATVHPEYPFWWLQTDQVWQVESDGPMEPRKGHRDPKRSELLLKHARGGFSGEIYDYLSANPQRAAAIAKDVLERNFPNSLWDDVLSAAGIPADDNVVTGSRRGSAFRRLVLEAYRFECCICGLKLQIGMTAFGVEAAHIKWHQAGGPEVVPNGLTLCLIHHKAFDRGAISLTGDCRVIVSKALHGDSSYEDLFGRFHDSGLRLPRDRTDWPEANFVEWHRTEVFRD